MLLFYAIGTIQSTAIYFEVSIAFDYEKRILSCTVVIDSFHLDF